MKKNKLALASARDMNICDNKHSLKFSSVPHSTVLVCFTNIKLFFYKTVFPRNFIGRRTDQCEKYNNQYKSDSCVAIGVNKGGKHFLTFHQT